MERERLAKWIEQSHTEPTAMQRVLAALAILSLVLVGAYCGS